MNNKVVWIIGSNASGKTTQSKMFHNSHQVNYDGGSLREIHEKKFINSKREEDRTSFSLFVNSAHVGALRDNQCTGTDSLSSKDQIDMAYCIIQSKYQKQYTLIDGIMATFQWCEMIKQVDVETYCVLLHFENEEDNFLRVQERRWKRNPTEYLLPLSDKTKKNVAGKINGFRNMYDKIEKEFDHSIIISATLNPIEIHNQILKFIL